MNVEQDHDVEVAGIAAAIGEPARARMLYCLLDGHARTSTELAMVADLSPSTASGHLARLKAERLVQLHVQGKHRYYSLAGPRVARTLEGLSVLAGATRTRFTPTTPSRLWFARTCYDHIAGTVGVGLHDRMKALAWIAPKTAGTQRAYELTASGRRGLETMGVDVEEIETMRRRFAYPCLDWSERRPHLGGALGAALLRIALKKRWVRQEPDLRALVVTNFGRAEMLSRFGLTLQPNPPATA